MEFKEPKVEIIKLTNNNVVFASYTDSGVEYCKGSALKCPDDYLDQA